MCGVASAALIAALFVPIILEHLSIIAFLPPVLIVSGLACLIAAKVSLFRRGIRFSSGSALMSKGYTSLYKAAYVLIGLGVLMMFASLGVLRGLE
jgi:hypothetical protein